MQESEVHVYARQLWKARGQKAIASALKNFLEVVGEIATRCQIKQQIGVQRQLLSGSDRLHK